MEVRLEIPEFIKDKGIKYQWEDGFDIETNFDNNVITISSNKEGLISLANHLLNLAQENVPIGYHLHFDTNNSLEDGSIELIIQKK